MPRRTPLPAELGLSFSHRAAVAAGVSQGRLQGRDVASPFRGVHSRGELHDLLALCLALSERMTGRWAFTHVTAARLHGMPLPSGLDGLLDVAVVAPRSAPTGRGIRGRKLASGAFLLEPSDELPVAAPADTWRQLAEVLNREDLVAAGDYLLSGNPFHGLLRAPLCSREDLKAAVERGAGKRGAKAAAWALPRLRDGVDSRPESLLRLLLVRAGLPEPVIHPAIAVDGGRRVLHPDLALPRWRTAFEYEGDGHRERRRWLQDMERYSLLEAEGWTVVKVTARDLFVDPEGLLRRVNRALARNRYPN